MQEAPQESHVDEDPSMAAEMEEYEKEVHNVREKIRAFHARHINPDNLEVAEMFQLSSRLNDLYVHGANILGEATGQEIDDLIHRLNHEELEDSDARSDTKRLLELIYLFEHAKRGQSH